MENEGRLGMVREREGKKVKVRQLKGKAEYEVVSAMRSDEKGKEECRGELK